MEKDISANDFCRYIWKIYLEERRYDLLDDYISDKISVIGTGAHEVERNLEEFLAAMAQEGREWNGRFIIRDQWYQTTELSEKNSLVMGEMTVRENASDGILYDICFRFTIVLEKTESGWKLLHIHQSVPDPNQTRDEFFPHHTVEQTYTEVVYNLRHDSLTGLLNRLYFKETCERFLASEEGGAFLMMDIDCFKQINDQYGHLTGDKLLVSFAESLKAVVSSGGIAGRVGGDEFAVFMFGVRQAEEVDSFLENLKNDWRIRQKALELQNPVSVSIGAAFFLQGEAVYAKMLDRADQALYHAKEKKGTELVQWEFDGTKSQG